LFPESAYARTFCVDPADGRGSPAVCTPVPVQNASVCLSATELAEAFRDAPNVLQSLYPRFDLRVSIMTQADDSSEMLDHVLSILLREVGGYSLTQLWTPSFSIQLEMCLAGAVDLFSEIWRTDYTDAVWESAFFGDPERATCEIVGVNGLLGQNAWMADTYSVAKVVEQSAVAGAQPVALDFWRSYATPAGVVGLPRFNATIAAEEVRAGLGFWFVPPQCRPANATCGSAYAWSMDWEPEVPQQQIVSLGWLVALFFPVHTNLFKQRVDAHIAAKEQVLIMASNTLSYTAGNTFVRVALPPTNLACLSGASKMDCDFRAQAVSLDRSQCKTENGLHRLANSMALTALCFLYSCCPPFLPCLLACFFPVVQNPFREPRHRLARRPLVVPTLAIPHGCHDGLARHGQGEVRSCFGR
jgi:hypothetical protein